MEREIKPFSKPWQLVDHAESFEVQDSADRTLAFVYFSDDPNRATSCAGCRRTMPGVWRSRSCGCLSWYGLPAALIRARRECPAHGVSLIAPTDRVWIRTLTAGGHLSRSR